jgi:hypothetical protein
VPTQAEVLARIKAEQEGAQPGFQPSGLALPEAEEDGGGFLGGVGDIFGGGADVFRAVVPQSARDVAGAVINNTLSGERFLNTIGGVVSDNEDFGTDISNKLREVDKIGGLLAIGFDVAASPATILTAGFGGQIAAGLSAGRLGVAGRIAASAIEPIAGGTAASATGRFGQRFAAENILGTTASAVSGEVAERLEGANPVVAGVSSLVAGALGGTAVLRTTSRKLPGLVGKQLPVTKDLTIGDTELASFRTDLRLNEIASAKSAQEVIDNLGFTAQLARKLKDSTNPGQRPGFASRLMQKALPKDGDVRALFREASVREMAHDGWVALRMVDFNDNFREFRSIFDKETGNVKVEVNRAGDIVLPPDMRNAVENMRGSLDESIEWEKQQGLEPQEIIGERDAYPQLESGLREMTFAEMFERVTGGRYFPKEIVEVDGVKRASGRMDPFTVAKRAPGFADDVPEQIATFEANLAAGTKYGSNVSQVFEDRLISGGRRGNAKWFRETASDPLFGGRTIGTYIDEHAYGIRTRIAGRSRDVRALSLSLEKKISRKVAQGQAVAAGKKAALRAKAAKKQLNAVEQGELRTIEAVESLRVKTLAEAAFSAKTFRKAKSNLNRPTAKVLKDSESGIERITEARDQIDKMTALLDEAANAKVLTESEIGSMRSKLDRFKVELDRDRGIVANLREAASQPQSTIGRVNVPQLGRSFPEAVGDSLNNKLSPGTENAMIRQIGSFNNVARSLMATLDLSAAGIQGLLALGSHPLQAMDALRVAWQSLVDPNVYADTLSKKKGTLENFIRMGGHFAGDDTGEFAFTQGLRKVPVLGKLFDKSNMAFTRTGNLMRLTLFEQALETNRLKGFGSKGALTKGVTEAEGRAIVQTINSATGFHAGKPSSWEKVGFFAPRYFRSQLDIIGKAMIRGGPDAQLARSMLFKTMMLGSGLTVLANEARGEKTEFNPLREDSKGNLRFNSNFMRIKNIGGKDVSVFGGWDSMLGLMTTAAVAGPQAGITRLMRTKASPALSTVFDIIEGETFDGQRIDLTTTEGFMNAVITEGVNKLPFTAQDTIEAFSNGEWPTSAAFNFFGVKSTATTKYEQRDMLAQQMFDSHWTDLTGQEKAEIEEARPQLFRDIQERDKDRAGLGDPSSTARLERDEIDQTRIKEESALGIAFQNGVISISDFTDRMDVLQASSSDQKRRVDSVLGLEFGEAANPNQKALSDWYDLSDAANIPGTGIRDWDLWESIEASFMADLNPEQTRFIEERSRPEHSPDIDWYYKAKDVIAAAGYYETVDAAFALMSPALRAVDAGVPINSYGALITALDAARKRGDQMLVIQLDGIARSIQQTAGAQKDLLRIGNPALDQALLTLGRVSKSLSFPA